MSGAQAIDQKLLAAVSGLAQASPRRRKNYNFHIAETELSHRLLNALEPESYIRPHCHVDAAKDESIIALRGKIGVVFFDRDGNITGTLQLEPGGETVGVNIPHGVYHSVVALAAGSVFFEAKAGPYAPLTAGEKAPWAPDEGDAAAAAADYLSLLKRRF